MSKTKTIGDLTATLCPHCGKHVDLFNEGHDHLTAVYHDPKATGLKKSATIPPGYYTRVPVKEGQEVLILDVVLDNPASLDVGLVDLPFIGKAIGVKINPPLQAYIGSGEIKIS